MFSRGMLWAMIMILVYPVVCWPYTKNFYLIHELNGQAVVSGTYETEGFVIKTHACLLNDEQEDGFVCDHDYVVVSEEKLILEKYFLSDKELIIFVEDAARFERGAKYRFLVQVLDVKTTKQKLNNLKLIYFEKLS